mmetsp:Transcript_66606/g.192358  ORF Transcript_66606/g.192358 Transcript_66606/m.192358 type:complete len:217 (+) Transcript_66606:698-1348(+)
MMCSAVASSTICAKSGNVAYTSKLNMEAARDLKYLSPNAVSFVTCLNVTLKRKTTVHNKSIVSNTERLAETSPLMRTISSGIARNRRPTRAMRQIRINLNRRRIPVLLICRPFTPALIKRIAVITHVSSTDINTRKESNTNALSRRALNLLSKAPRRMTHSSAKIKQKQCSSTWNHAGASSRMSASLYSASTAIQIVFRKITHKMETSKVLERAMA